MILTIVILHFSIRTQSQMLTIGDKVPNVLIENIINYRYPSVSLESLRGKLIIIDFWGTTCSSCIAALPKIDSLQQLFSDKIQTFTITNFDKEEAVWTTLKRNRHLKNLKLPVVLGGQNLKDLFPHQIVSHVAWIGGDGIVKAITGTEYITESNIQKVLNGEDINWPVKQDIIEFDYSKPIIVKRDKINTAKGIYSSAFTDYIKGIDGTDRLFVDSTAGTITSNHFNHTLLAFIDGSFQGLGTGYIDTKHLILQVKDPGRYLLKDKYMAEWSKQNTYTYSYTLPLTLSGEEIRNFVRRDLSNWLDVIGIKAWKEKRMQKVWILKRTSYDNRLLISKGKKSDTSLGEGAGKLKQLVNEPLSSLVYHLNLKMSGIPWVFDETKIPDDMQVDLQLKIDSFRNLPELRKALKKYGLDIEETEREMEMYVIREKDYKEKASVK